MATDSPDDQLRLLYLDWCSAQVARRFLELSLDEVWLRADLAASLPTPTPDAAPAVALERIPGYLDLVRKTALLLAQELDLPSFADWSRAYLADPAHFDADILG